jgi:sulfhydrogenase subunit beta (sulfur reductase)
MRVFRLNCDNLIPFLTELESFGELWGPVKKGTKHVYGKADPEEFDLGAVRTIIPAKKLVFPPHHRTWRFQDMTWEEEVDVTEKVLFGIHPCGIHGLNIYHKFYTRLYPDPHYLRWREATLVVGLSCMPDEHCFCYATDTDTVNEGFDIFVTNLEDFCLVWIGSPKGDKATMRLMHLFEPTTQIELDQYIKWRKKREDSFRTQIDLDGMPEIANFSLDSDIWSTIGDACLGCGACSMVCPTCTCFDVQSGYNLIEKESERTRYWYSCMYREYSMVAGGHDFRASRSERLKLWYTHKLIGFMSEYGSPACVGCGRCLVNCPVDINIYSVVKALRHETTDAFWQKMESKDAATGD